MKKKPTTKKARTKKINVRGKAVKKGPGIIDSIVAALQRGPVTKQQILAKLCKAFPDRPAEGMAYTITAQLTRLPKTRGLNIVKSEEGYAIQ